MSRTLRVRATLGGRASAFRHITFTVHDDGAVTVQEGDVLVDRFTNFASALTSFGLRRTHLEPIEVATEWDGLPLRGL